MLRLTHVGDGVADRLPAQVVGHLGDRGDLRAPGREQGDDLGLADLLPGPDAVEHLAPPRRPDSSAVQRVPAGDRRRIGVGSVGGGCRRRSTRRWSGGRPGRPRRRCRRWRRPGAARARSRRGRRGPATRRRSGRAPGTAVAGSSQRSGSRGELGVDRQPRRQHAARGPRSTCAQRVDGGPRALGVDVVGGDRRDAAPVVDPRVEQDAERRRRGSAAPGRARRPAGSAGPARSPAGSPRAGTAGASRIAVPGLGRKFWTITSCT